MTDGPEMNRGDVTRERGGLDAGCARAVKFPPRFDRDLFFGSFGTRTGHKLLL